MRGIGDHSYLVAQTTRHSCRLIIGDTEDVCVIEVPFPYEAFGVYGQPSTRAKVEHVPVVHVSMQNHNPPLTSQQVRCCCGSGTEDSPLCLRRAPEGCKPTRKRGNCGG